MQTIKLNHGLRTGRYFLELDSADVHEVTFQGPPPQGERTVLVIKCESKTHEALLLIHGDGGEIIVADVIGLTHVEPALGETSFLVLQKTFGKIHCVAHFLDVPDQEQTKNDRGGE